MASTDSNSVHASARQFATTRWTAVLTAVRTDSPHATEALDQLCRTYWYPLYAWIRRQGYAPHDAQDLIQGFFARLLEKRDLAEVDPARGRFRSFLLASLKHYLANERDRERAWKRGGCQQFVPLDPEHAESRFAIEPSLSADQIYDRRWALTVLEQVMLRLRAEFCQRGKASIFDQLKACLTGTEPGVTTGNATQGTSPSTPSLEEIARRFPQLEILGLIGQGGMGIVYKARQPKLDRMVALKILPLESGKDPAFAERFAREARTLARRPSAGGLNTLGGTGVQCATSADP